jgi:hypothetical protein
MWECRRKLFNTLSLFFLQVPIFVSIRCLKTTELRIRHGHDVMYCKLSNSWVVLSALVSFSASLLVQYSFELAAPSHGIANQKCQELTGVPVVPSAYWSTRENTDVAQAPVIDSFLANTLDVALAPICASSTDTHQCLLVALAPISAS